MDASEADCQFGLAIPSPLSAPLHAIFPNTSLLLFLLVLGLIFGPGSPDEPEMNAKDGIYSGLPKDDQAQVTIAFAPVEKAADDVQAMLKETFKEETWPEGITAGAF